MPDLVIIADDLTGALDAASPFAGHPAGVAVATRPDALGEVLHAGAGVIAVSTRSREIAGAEARARVAAVLAALPAGVILFKKIDSRLKGNIADELAPFGEGPLLVSPAIPDLGRVVRDGRLEGAGVAAPIPVRARLGAADAHAQVPDAPDDAALTRMVAAAPAGTVFVGARGLGLALARRMALQPPPATPPLPAPACIVVGSTDPITLAQVAALKAARSDLVLVEAPSGRLPAMPEGPHAALTLLQAVPGPQRAPADVARDFARGAARWLGPARSTLLTGGATAEAVLEALGVSLLHVAGEALPGMPHCRGGAWTIVTKSGGFGEPDALVRLAPAAG